MQSKSICKCKRGEKANKRRNYKKMRLNIKAHLKMSQIKDRIYKCKEAHNILQSMSL